MLKKYGINFRCLLFFETQPNFFFLEGISLQAFFLEFLAQNWEVHTIVFEFYGNAKFIRSIMVGIG